MQKTRKQMAAPMARKANITTNEYNFNFCSELSLLAAFTPGLADRGKGLRLQRWAQVELNAGEVFYKGIGALKNWPVFPF